MTLVNKTKLTAGYIMTTDKTGREAVVVVAKGTYGIPTRPDLAPQLLPEQVPLVTTDVFSGEPGFSAPLSETEFAPTKPRCDVLLNGSCYAPGGKATRQVEVALQLGSLRKAFSVLGPRTYEAGLASCKPGAPAPFTALPISYGNAYGGVDRTNVDPAKHQWYPLNHAGVGYYPKATVKELNGRPLPNTEELDNPVRRPDGSYKSMAFGPVGRAWQQRIRWAGTYDQEWLDRQYPFLPEDFDPRYFQTAAEDQQVEYPRGGEEVVLKNLTPQGQTTFLLPAEFGLPVLFFSRDGGVKEVAAVVDTVLLEPDQSRFVLVWRASLAVRRTIREVREITLGPTRGPASQDIGIRSRGK